MHYNQGFALMKMVHPPRGCNSCKFNVSAIRCEVSFRCATHPPTHSLNLSLTHNTLILSHTTHTLTHTHSHSLTLTHSHSLTQPFRSSYLWQWARKSFITTRIRHHGNVVGWGWGASISHQRLGLCQHGDDTTLVSFSEMDVS